jgi:hypothetical protein
MAMKKAAAESVIEEENESGNEETSGGIEA